MKKADLAISFIPFVIYCTYLAVIQSWVGGDFLLMGLLVSFLGTIFYVLHARALMKNVIVLNKRLLLITSLIVLTALAAIAVEDGTDRDIALIAGSAVYIITALLFMFISFSATNDAYTIFDTDTECTYRVVNGVAYKLHDEDSKRYSGDQSIRHIDLSSSAIPVAAYGYRTSLGSDNSNHDPIINSSSGLPMYNGVSGLDVGGNTWGNSNSDTGSSVNPVSGLPMNGGMSGIDVGGNSWGTTAIDSSGNSSSYDPNRGY